MLEHPTRLSPAHLASALPLLFEAGVLELIQSLNDEYAYWDRVKYVAKGRHLPAESLWMLVKLSRAANYTTIWARYTISFLYTRAVQRRCHALMPC